ncbi:MAG: hypothetical protein NUV32_10275 [Exilispira sp.]|nr:hypothetical protein [Exilispira sp.]
MKKNIKFISLFIFILMFLMTILLINNFAFKISAQQTTTTTTQTTTQKVQVVDLSNFAYSFVNFSSNYATLQSKLKSSSYNIEEKDINSPNGKFLIIAEKKLNFMTEKLYLYFDYKKNLIYFQVSFLCEDAYTRKPLEKLYQQLVDKLNTKYGESQNKDYGYYKKTDTVEVVLFPIYPFKNSIEIQVKNVTLFNQYSTEYMAEMEKGMNQEVSSIVNTF